MDQYDNECSETENMARGLFAVARAIRSLNFGSSEVPPAVELGFIVEKALGGITSALDDMASALHALAERE